MAEIHVERKPDRNVAAWIAGAVVLLLLAGAAWYFLLGPGQVYLDRGAEGADPAGVSAPAAPAPGGSPDRGP